MRNTTTIQSGYHLIFRHLFSVCLTCLSVLLIYTFAHAAGINTDGSLGPATTLTGPNYTIPPELGQQKGSNLFHSFGNFNVNKDESATFTGPDGTTNVISRVTGGNSSWIDGRLGCNITGANLWLLNPFGILFGSNASLNVNGSFHASTADYLQLSDGGVFYTDPSKTSKLTIAAPSAFGFLSSKPEGITISGSTLTVPEGEIISIIGGDIRIENGNLFASGGRVNLASLGSPGTVEIVSDGLKVEASNGLGDINISGSEDASKTAIIDVSGVDDDNGISGRVDIYCKKFSLLDDSAIRSNNYSKYKGGKIRLIAEESISIGNLSVISSRNNGEGAGGDIDIQTGYLSLTNAGQIGTLTQGRGDSGDVTIKAKDVLIDGGFESISGSYLSGIYSPAVGRSTGSSGNVDIITESLALSNGGMISAYTSGYGDGGHVTIKAKDVLIDGGFETSDGFHSSNISCDTNMGSSGRAGRVNIDTESFTLSNGGAILVGTYGHGDGGVVIIKAKDVLIDGGFENSDGFYRSIISCQTNTGSTGDAGGVKIDTESFTLSNGGEILAGTYGGGNGGVVTIKAKDVLIAGEINTSSSSTGTAGSIDIQTNTLNMNSGATISSASTGTGNAGSIMIAAKDSMLLNDAAIKVEASKASAGDIKIQTPNLDMTKTSLITASVSGGSGSGGSIDLNVDTLSITEGSRIESNTAGSGSGGNITVAAGASVTISGKTEEASGMYSTSTGAGSAGSITVQTPILNISDSG
jgi:filamentous hemagglutinin family protein